MQVNNRLQLYPLLRIVLAMLPGMVVGDMFDAYSTLYTALCLLIGCMLLYPLFAHKPYFQGFILLCSVFFGGVCLVGFARISQTDVSHAIPKDYSALVYSTPVRKGKTARCDLLVVPNNPNKQAHFLIKATFLDASTAYSATNLHIGNAIRFRSPLKPIVSTQQNHFNYAKWARAHGYHATAFIYPDAWIDTPSAPLWQQLSFLSFLQLRALQYRENLLSVLRTQDWSTQYYALLSALALGDKSYLNADIRQNFANAGVSHVLALSGLHLGILYTLLFFLFSLAPKRILHNDLYVVCYHVFLLIALWSYAFITGLSTSMLRASLMLSIYTFANIVYHDKNPLNTLALSALIILLIAPFSLWDIGFQLSFMGVFSILLFYKQCYRLGGRWLRYRLFSYLWGTTSVGICSQLGVIPIILYAFGQFSFSFLLSNLLVIPLVSCILYGVVFLFLVHSFSFLSTIIGWFISVCLSLMFSILNFFSTHESLSAHHYEISLAQVFLLYLFIFCTYAILHYLHKLWKIRNTLHHL